MENFADDAISVIVSFFHEDDFVIRGFFFAERFFQLFDKASSEKL